MTGQELYRSALDLLGIRMANGDVPQTTNDLAARAVSIINLLLAENMTLNARLEKTAPKLTLLRTLSDGVDASERLLWFAFPYGLAAKLIAAEDSELSSYLESRYLSAIAKLEKQLKACAEGISEVY